MNNIKYYLDRVAEIFAEEQFVFEPHELYEPIDYTLRLGGKRIRPTLLLAANGLFGGNEEQVRDATLGIETFCAAANPRSIQNGATTRPSSAATPCSPSPGDTS